MAVNYPFNLFNTRINLSQDYIKITPDIFGALTRHIPTNDTYILRDLYMLEIEKYRKDKNINYQDAERIGLLQNFNDNVYDHVLIRFPKILPTNIEEFCRLFIKYKNDIITIIQDINYFFVLFNKNIKKKEDVYFINPINPIFDNYGLIDINFIDSRIKTAILGQDKDDIRVALNIFTNSTIINIKMPSIGLINNRYLITRPGKPYRVYNTFINFILNELLWKESNISTQIPLRDLNLGDTLCDFLLIDRPIENLNLNNSNVFSNRFNNSTIRQNILDIIDRIQINLNDVLRHKKTKTKENRINAKYKVKPEYLIPYRIHTIPGPPQEIKIIYMKKSEVDKELDSLDKTFLHNQKLVKQVLEETIVLYLPGTRQDIDKAITNLDKPNYKNILACFIYIVIRLVYTISKNYIDRINDIIISMSQTRKGRFKGLNYKDALGYLTELDKSLFNFRNILLNNFYNMFLPSTISKMGYGMTSDINGCFVPEQGCVFLGENKNILLNFPIESCENMNPYVFPAHPSDAFGNITPMYKIHPGKLDSFIVKIYDKYDIYDRRKILEIGGYIFNNDIMKFTSKILKEYYAHLRNIMEYNLFIFEKLTNYFNVKKMIPIGVIQDFAQIRLKMLRIVQTSINRNADYQELDKEAFSKFEYNLFKSTEYYKKMYSIKIKIQKIKNVDIRKLYNQQDMYLMCFNIFYRKAMVLYSMTQNLTANNKLKFELLKKFNERKKFYEDEINNFMQTV
jgi:hypothetical protein